jgi:hypothetical protein
MIRKIRKILELFLNLNLNLNLKILKLSLNLNLIILNMKGKPGRRRKKNFFFLEKVLHLSEKFGKFFVLFHFMFRERG